ncbi:MAG TPA: hypothetical protein VIQ24_19035 [Pyrinomonadaceae bacterium]
MNDERIVAYLLGELPEEESERFEDECYFAGEDWPEEIRAAEHDLVGSYLRNELTTEQRLHFEQNYLTTEKRLKRVATAAALLGHIKTTGEEKTSEQVHDRPTWINSVIALWHRQSWAMRAGLVVGVVTVVVGTMWLAGSRRSPSRSFATLNLTIADSVRAEGAQPNRVQLSPGTDGLRIYMKLPGSGAGAASYRVELENEEGEKNAVDALGRDTETVTVEIPATRLRRGQYALRLFAVRPDGGEQRVSGLYYFMIE